MVTSEYCQKIAGCMMLPPCVYVCVCGHTKLFCRMQDREVLNAMCAALIRSYNTTYPDCFGDVSFQKEIHHAGCIQIAVLLQDSWMRHMSV